MQSCRLPSLVRARLPDSEFDSANAEGCRMDDPGGVSRRDFSLRLAGGGAALSFFSRPAARPAPAPTFTDQLIRAAGRGGPCKSGFWPTADLAHSAGLPVVGVHHHLWFGNAGQFRAERSPAAEFIAGEVSGLIGTRLHRRRVVALCDGFFGHPKVATESPVFVLVCAGHITTRHAFAQRGYVARNLPMADGDVGVLRPRGDGKLVLDFGGGWSGYGAEFDLPQGMRPPAGRSDVALVRRCRLREYRTPDGLASPAKDFIVQYSTADADPTGEDRREISAGGYYPNSEPFRRPLNDRGYTDSTSVVFVRAVGGPRGRRVHQVNVNFNLELIRDRLAPDDQSNPEEVLDINTVTRPLDRAFDQYAALRGVLEREVLAKL